MSGEYTPARRRSGRRTHGGRADTDPDSGSQEPGESVYESGVTRELGETELAQPAWSQSWQSDDPEPTRARKKRGRRYGESGGRVGLYEDPEAGHERLGRPGATDKPAHEDPEAKAREICLRQLSFAPKTRSQLKEALLKREIPEDVADAVLSRYADVGLIDDAAFARAWVESRHHSKGLAGRALKAELRRRGVADDDIKDAVATLDPEAEVETARRLVEQKLPGTRGKPADVRTRRLAGMLARKGYSPGLAFRLIREALEAEGAEQADTLDALDTLGDLPPDDL
ncbi:MAG TPA: regulatory protein RecX [Trebonia sp.]|jgi:regulatory protein